MVCFNSPKKNILGHRSATELNSSNPKQSIWGMLPFRSIYFHICPLNYSDNN